MARFLLKTDLLEIKLKTKDTLKRTLYWVLCL